MVQSGVAASQSEGAAGCSLSLELGGKDRVRNVTKVRRVSAIPYEERASGGGETPPGGWKAWVPGGGGSKQTHNPGMGHVGFHTKVNSRD